MTEVLKMNPKQTEPDDEIQRISEDLLRKKFISPS